MKLSAARKSELAREVACARIFDGGGLDVEDLQRVTPEPGVGQWVDVRVLVHDEQIEGLARVQRKHRRRARR